MVSVVEWWWGGWDGGGGEAGGDGERGGELETWVGGDGVGGLGTDKL